MGLGLGKSGNERRLMRGVMAAVRRRGSRLDRASIQPPLTLCNTMQCYNLGITKLGEAFSHRRTYCSVTIVGRCIFKNEHNLHDMQRKSTFGLIFFCNFIIQKLILVVGFGLSELIAACSYEGCLSVRWSLGACGVWIPLASLQDASLVFSSSSGLPLGFGFVD
jgi:hypothetical protein